MFSLSRILSQLHYFVFIFYHIFWPMSIKEYGDCRTMPLPTVLCGLKTQNIKSQGTLIARTNHNKVIHCLLRYQLELGDRVLEFKTVLGRKALWSNGQTPFCLVFVLYGLYQSHQKQKARLCMVHKTILH